MRFSPDQSICEVDFHAFRFQSMNMDGVTDLRALHSEIFIWPSNSRSSMILHTSS